MKIKNDFLEKNFQYIMDIRKVSHELNESMKKWMDHVGDRIAEKIQYKKSITKLSKSKDATEMDFYFSLTPSKKSKLIESLFPWVWYDGEDYIEKDGYNRFDFTFGLRLNLLKRQKDLRDNLIKYFEDNFSKDVRIGLKEKTGVDLNICDDGSAAILVIAGENSQYLKIDKLDTMEDLLTNVTEEAVRLSNDFEKKHAL